MIYDAVSSKAVIGKVYRDTTIDNPSFEYDAIEWIGEALEWIGTGGQLIDKEAWIISTNHSAVLPSELHRLKGVWVVNDAPLKNNWRQSNFPYDLEAVEDKQKYKLERSDQQLHDGIGDASTDLQKSNLYDDKDEIDTSFQQLQGTGSGDPVKTNNISYDYKETYHLNGNVLKTSFEAGLLLIAYKGLPLDQDGYPLVPDDVAFKEACSWHIIKKLALQGRTNNIDYELAEQKWLKRATQARNRMNMPDQDEYEKFLQSWTKMVETERYNKGNIGHVSDGREGEPDTFNYRVTEDGVTRITESGDTRLTE